MSDAKLKNEDFRKLLASSSSSSSTKINDNKSFNSTNTSFTHRKIGNSSIQNKLKTKKYIPRNENIINKPNDDNDDIFDESQARLVEILKNYRDRASERRKGMFSDETEISKLIRASKETENIASVLDTSAIESRKSQIQKSKYLGGDMAHTHLVKGLDYSLLNKVRNEIHERQIIEKEKALNDPIVVSSDPTLLGTKLAKNINKILFETKLPQKNELFVKGRMAYLVELDEEESDVPSTLLRSAVETTTIEQSNANINADNLIINKLSQVLVYLRTDLKKKKKNCFEQDNTTKDSTNIFEGLDEYVSTKNVDNKKNVDDRRRHKDEESSSDQKKSYFSNNDNERTHGHDSRSGMKDRKTERRRERVDEEVEKRRLEKEKLEKEMLEKEENLQKKRCKLEQQEDAYAEFYPGGIGMLDAGGESDDDDFTQMDQGSKKSQIKRWDFDTQEDYERYQNQREAHPRAVYQFGVKTTGGRKTRKNVSAANEKKIDRELDKINKILERGTNQSIRY